MHLFLLFRITMTSRGDLCKHLDAINVEYDFAIIKVVQMPVYSQAKINGNEIRLFLGAKDA